MSESREAFDNIILKKKISYVINPNLRIYLQEYNRNISIPLRYEDLKRYNFSMPLLDQKNQDTLWESVYYSETDRAEIFPALTRIYAILKIDGDMSIIKHLAVDRVDYCTFGNSNPFRIKIVNNFNDNYDYFYVKIADASRVYGLEIEHILSPNRIGYIVDEQTLVEEHIAGIPGDMFIKDHLTDPKANETRIAKEFVKFNERCFVKLLGDMRSYNFVIDMTPDFDNMQYRIRAIDFDQQCYEGQKKLYLPQFFKENYPFVQLCMKHMNNAETILQYQLEERTLMAKRVKSAHIQIRELISLMKVDVLSLAEKTKQLKEELAEHYQNNTFLKCQTMGEIVERSLSILMDKNAKKITSSIYKHFQ